MSRLAFCHSPWSSDERVGSRWFLGMTTKSIPAEIARRAAKDLAKQPFGAVSGHRIAEFAGHRNPQPSGPVVGARPSSTMQLGRVTREPEP